MTAPKPEHVVLAPGVGATVIPTGKLSINAALSVADVAFGLVSVMVNTLVPPTAMIFGEKSLVMAGRGVITTHPPVPTVAPVWLLAGDPVPPAAPVLAETKSLTLLALQALPLNAACEVKDAVPSACHFPAWACGLQPPPEPPPPPPSVVLVPPTSPATGGVAAVPAAGAPFCPALLFAPPCPPPPPPATNNAVPRVVPVSTRLAPPPAPPPPDQPEPDPARPPFPPFTRLEGAIPPEPGVSIGRYGAI